MGAFLTSLCSMLKSSSGPGKGHPTRVTICQVVFSIERLLGEGGYAFVYKAVAQNSNLRLGIRQGMHVALKRFVVRDDAVLLLDGSGRPPARRGGGGGGATQQSAGRSTDRDDSDPEGNPSSTEEGTNTPSMEDGIVEEVQLQQALSSHSNIVACYGHEIIHPNSSSNGTGGSDHHGGIGVIKPRAEVWVIMELAGESVQSIVNQAIARGRKLDVTFEVLPVLADTISALAFMHGLPNPVSHWDVKLDNILACQEKLAADGSVIQDGSGGDSATASTTRYKLCDFGSASKVFYLPRDGKQITIAETELDEKMTLLYRPPESLDLWEKKRIDTQADVWSLGVVLYVLLFNKMPFEDSKQSVINARVTMPPLEGSSAAGAIARQNITSELRNLCQRMLTRDPDQRPTIWDCSAALHAFYPAHKPITPPATIGKQPPRF